MKKLFKRIYQYYIEMETLSFALLTGGFFSCCVCIAAAIVIQSHPNLLKSACDAEYYCMQLKELGAGLLLCGAILGFLSDIIIKHDFKE